MRDIKFRHYDTRLEEMRYSDKNDGEFYINLKGVMYMYAIPKSESGLETEFYKSYEVMQYTGLQDRKGNDIYEDDICEIGGIGLGIVEICRYNGTQFKTLDGYDVPLIDCLAEDNEFEIVGNIYQNPELLNGDNNG